MIRQNSEDDKGPSLRSASQLFVLTGAGISAESGIPIFQGTNWRGHSHYELANIEAWERDPKLVWQYYSDRRARAMPSPTRRIAPSPSLKKPAGRAASFSALKTWMACMKPRARKRWSTSTA